MTTELRNQKEKSEVTQISNGKSPQSHSHPRNWKNKGGEDVGSLQDWLHSNGTGTTVGTAPGAESQRQPLLKNAAQVRERDPYFPMPSAFLLACQCLPLVKLLEKPGARELGKHNLQQNG